MVYQTARWSSGQDGGLSRPKREFDSPTGHHNFLWKFKNKIQLVLLTVRVHPFPFRTRKLSSPVPTILAWRRAGKIGQRQHKDYGEMINASLRIFIISKNNGALLCHPVIFFLSYQSAEFSGKTLRLFYEGS